MRRTLTIVGLVVVVSLLHAPEVRAGSPAGELFISFTGPALNATLEINLDSVAPDPSGCPTPAGDFSTTHHYVWSGAPCPVNATAAIRLNRGSKASAAIFAAPLTIFQNGCDGVNGASIPLNPQPSLADLTDTRFLGINWIPPTVLTGLLAPFGISSDPDHPLVFSDIANPVCTKIGDIWILSFTGTMQLGKNLAP